MKCIKVSAKTLLRVIVDTCFIIYDCKGTGISFGHGHVFYLSFWWKRASSESTLNVMHIEPF